MGNTINVKLDSSSSPQHLDVEDNGGQNIIAKTREPQVITWRLTGQLARGSFVSMDAPSPGFEWLDQPPMSSVFGKPHIWATGKALSITDYHSSEASDGEWVYRLRVSLNGKIYETTADSGSLQADAAMLMVARDPIIINR